jgi:hypothetical protein
MARAAGVVALSILAFLVGLAVSGVGGCNVHEFGHLVTGWIAGVPVDDVIWCTPSSGRVAFSYQEPAWVSYAGGLLAAAVLMTVYWLVVVPRIDVPMWRAGGVAVLGTATSQIIVGILKGSSVERYAALQDNNGALAGLIVVPLLAAAVLQRIRWPLRHGSSPEHTIRRPFR